MNPVRLNRTWLIGLIIFILALSVSHPFADVPIPGHADFIPNYRELISLNNQAVFFNEQHPNYQAFLAKPVRVPVFISESLDWIEYNVIGAAKFADQNNLYTAMMVITLFIMFYRLARTFFEKPGLQEMTIRNAYRQLLEEVKKCRLQQLLSS
jgi:hypothetical protein